MANTKYTNVFFDIETLKTNTAAKNPKDWVVREYVVSMEMKIRGKYQEFLFPNLKEMLLFLISKKIQNKRFKLIAHNGRGFDFHFLRRTLLDDFGLSAATIKNEKYTEHQDKEYTVKDLAEMPNLLLEGRIKAKTKIDITFMLGGKLFVTEDSYPHFQDSIRGLGNSLIHHGLLEPDEGKLSYSYSDFDVEEKLSLEEVREYCYDVFNKLSEHDKHYVHNDTHIMRLAWDNYNKLFPGFDISLPTLTTNILKVYSINALATYQLTRKIKRGNKTTDFPLTRFEFEPAKELDDEHEGDERNGNLFTYIHHWYHGGLNFYNETCVGRTVHDAVHIDINSSYPTAMYNEMFPTQLIDYVDSPGKIVLDKDKDKYYLLQVPLKWFSGLLEKIPSRVFRQMQVKRFPMYHLHEYVFLQSPDIELLERAIRKDIKEVPVRAALVYRAERFGGREVIKEKYAFKTEAKQKGYSKEEVRVAKLILNGLYGLPALRAHFNVYKYINGELTMCGDGFENNERNILFAAATTSYAYRNLLLPLTYNLKDLDKGYIYTDTDSHFLTREYWQTIKEHVHLDPYELGAWDMEHKHIKNMTVLNHKKYCLLNDNDEIEVYCGGIPKDAFDTKMPYDKFIKTQFTDGVEIKNLRNTYTHDQVICLYDATTNISKGGSYDTHYSLGQATGRMLAEEEARYDYYNNDGLDDDRDNEALYYETTYGSFGASEISLQAYNDSVGTKFTVEDLISIEEEVFNEIN